MRYERLPWAAWLIVFVLALGGCTAKPKDNRIIPEAVHYDRGLDDSGITDPIHCPTGHDPIGKDVWQNRRAFARMIQDPKVQITAKIDVSGDTVKISHYNCEETK
jgi:hypothetical protein